MSYPIAGKIVSGLRVRNNIPNLGSISASFNDYTVLDGIREVPLSDFNAEPRKLFYAADDVRRAESLAGEIKNNREINPLIVAIDADGPYILEGAHRLGALYLIGAKSFPALVVLDEDDVIESNPRQDKQYEIMKPLETLLREDEINVIIDSYVKRFKRRDRIDYMLLLDRMSRILESVNNTSTTQLNLMNIYFKFFNKFDTDLKPEKPKRLSVIEERRVAANLQDALDELTHIMDMINTGLYPKTDAISFRNQDPTKLVQQLLASIESEKKEQRRIDKKDAGELIVDCGDGFGWYLVGEDLQKAEAAAMSHCAACRVNGVILSLREDKGEYLKPHLTFEYVSPPELVETRRDFFDSEGYLGEMKGYANNKPSADYHPYVVCLLQLPQIVAVIGGGYKPENNFSITDLSKELTEFIKSVRPELFDYKLLSDKTLQSILPHGYKVKDGEIFKFSHALTFTDALRSALVHLNMQTNTNKMQIRHIDEYFGVPYNYYYIDIYSKEYFNKEDVKKINAIINEKLEEFSEGITFDNLTINLERELANAMSKGIKKVVIHELINILEEIFPINCVGKTIRQNKTVVTLPIAISGDIGTVIEDKELSRISEILARACSLIDIGSERENRDRNLAKHFDKEYAIDLFADSFLSGIDFQAID